MSIYRAISENLDTEGKLLPDFRNPFKSSSDEISFMPGAKDGIGIYHLTLKPSIAVAKKIVKLIKKDLKGGNINSWNEIARLLYKYEAVSLIDPILYSINENKEGIDTHILMEYAHKLAFESRDEDLVKLGISLCGFADSLEKPLIDKLLVLALYEEFTIYVIGALSGYRESNDLFFELAKKVHGWGKIHVVSLLEATREEIRQWILRRGCTNSIMDAYLGLECANKGDMIRVLRNKSIDSQLYDGISIIIDAMLEEGPTYGISNYEYPKEALERYLIIAKSHAQTIKHLWRILNLRDWLESSDKDYRWELLSVCNDIISRPSWEEITYSVLRKANHEDFLCASDVASRLDYDVNGLIFEALKKEPIKLSSHLPLVYKNPIYAEELTKLYIEVYPHSKIAIGMGDRLFIEDLVYEQMCLDFLLLGLIDYPNMGEPLVETALKSPVTRLRNGACQVMEEWCNLKEMNLQLVSANLYSLLKETLRKEVNLDTKKRMKKVLKIRSMCEQKYCL